MKIIRCAQEIATYIGVSAEQSIQKHLLSRKRNFKINFKDLDENINWDRKTKIKKNLTLRA